MVFDFEDFLKARIADIDVPGQERDVKMLTKILGLHQPVLVTWHPSWFCSCCTGEEEPEHHMGISMYSMQDGLVTQDYEDPGPLSAPGADWPCETLLAVAEMWSDHPDYGKWIPGIRQQQSEMFASYILNGGPASDGQFLIRADVPEYLYPEGLGENGSFIQLHMANPEQHDGDMMVQFGDHTGGYVYHHATGTLDWEERPVKAHPGVIRFGRETS